MDWIARDSAFIDHALNKGQLNELPALLASIAEARSRTGAW